MTRSTQTHSTDQRALSGRRLAHLLLALGVFCLLAAVMYAAGTLLNSWLRDQNRYLLSQDIAPLSDPNVAQLAWSKDPAAAQSTGPAVSERDTAPANRAPQAPVRIHIPDLGVTRSVVNVPAVLDPSTGTVTRDVERLFRPGRKDLVGHWGGSSIPGQTGNMILVGHNYGIGYSGVFVRLGRLKAGQKVHVTDAAGTSFTYVVETVERLKWRKKNPKELEAHWEYLSPSGPERLTLVTCGGANIEPFPDRIYVVAYPVP